MLFLLLSFENDHGDVRILLRFGELLLNLAHELDVDVDLLIWLELTLHGSDGEHLLGLSLLHAEIEADWVLTLVLEVKREFLWLSNSDSSEVKLGLHTLIESDIEGLSVDLNLLLFLLDLISFDILNLELDGLEEFLLDE